MPQPTAFAKPPREPFFERLSTALALQGRIIGALFLRETRTRFGDSLIGYAWTVFEPAFNIVLWAVLFKILNRQAPLGDSMLLFVSSAFFPFMLFRDLADHLMPAITANRSLLQFPIVHNIDVILGRALLEIVTSTGVMAFFFALFGAFGLQFWPAHPLDMLMAMLAIALLGFGFGAINAVVACLFHSWPKIFPWFGRLSYVASGVFFLPPHLPQAAQDAIWYLPMTHAVEWFRQAFFEGYEASILSPFYLLSWGAAATFTGLALERALRRQISIER